jgi:DNA-binding transcriptional LysR family regulator
VHDALNPRRLRYFRTVAEAGSMTGAARRLNVAQPALSYHVAEIEAAVGLTLLERRRDGVRLTCAGEVFYRHSGIITDAVDAALRDLGALARGERTNRRIRIAIFPSLAEGLIPAIARAIATVMPGTETAFREAPSTRACNLIDRGEVDFAIHLAADDEGDELLWREDLLFVQSRTPDFAEGPVPLAEVLAHPLVLPSAGNPLRVRIEAAAQALGLPVRVALEIDGWASRRSAIIAGLGPSVAGAHALRAQAAALEGWAEALGVRQIVSPRLTRQIGLRIRKGVDNEAAELVRAALQVAGDGLGLSAATA